MPTTEENKTELENTKGDLAIKEAMETHNHAEAEFWLSEWVGAIFYYLINFGKIPFSVCSEKRFLNRNVWTGWILRMVAMFIFVWFIWRIISNLS